MVTDTHTDSIGRDWSIGWSFSYSGIVTVRATAPGHDTPSTLTRDGLTTAPGVVEAPMQEALEILSGIAVRGGGDVAPDEDWALSGALTRALPTGTLLPLGADGWPALKVGDRVVLRRDVERFPHFIAPKGATGTVVDTPSHPLGAYSVLLDQHLSGAESWDNEVVWSESDIDHLLLDIAPLVAGGSPWAPPARSTGWHPEDCPCARCR